MGYNNPKRVGPYRRFHDLLIDAYGEPGEDYPPSIEHRLDRMSRIAVRDVVEKIELWRERYGASAGGSPRSARVAISTWLASRPARQV